MVSRSERPGAGNKGRIYYRDFYCSLKEREITTYGMSISTTIHGNYGGMQVAEMGLVID